MENQTILDPNIAGDEETTGATDLTGTVRDPMSPADDTTTPTRDPMEAEGDAGTVPGAPGATPGPAGEEFTATVQDVGTTAEEAVVNTMDWIVPTLIVSVVVIIAIVLSMAKK